jgi:hypothetical protein
MSDPALCQPPDPTVSGRWWVSGIPYNNEFPLWWDGFYERWHYGYSNISAKEAYKRWRILGPVPTHAEVEALREELTNMEALRDGDARALRQFDTQLTAARARVAKLEAGLRLIEVGQAVRVEFAYIGRPWSDIDASDIAREALTP